MAVLHTGSDLVETILTPHEKNVAMQMADKNLSYMYLQNSRVEIFRQLASQEFTDPLKDGENHRARAYLKGKLDLLADLLEGILNPDPVPVENPVSQPGGNTFNSGE
jgi:putative sterol carrier protein